MKSARKNDSKESKAIRYYCASCKLYLTYDSYITNHIDHDIIDLAEKYTLLLAEYQKLSKTVSLLSGRRQVHIKDESIEGIVQNIQAKITKAKTNLQEDIEQTITNTSDYLLKSPLIREFSRIKLELEGKDNEQLLKVKDELSNYCKQLVVSITQDNYESVDKAIDSTKLKEYEKIIKELSEKADSDVEFIQELRKLKDTKVEYSYDPLAVLGMIRVESRVKKPPRIIQFNRESNEVNVYNINTKKKVKTALMVGFVFPFRFVSIECGNNVYLNGGDNGHSVYLKSHYLYDELRGSLLPLSDMNEGRSRHALASVEGRIYAIGGENTKGALSHTEYYQVAENRWTASSELNEPRCGLAACALKNTIYAIGGWNQDYLSSIEALDTSEPKSKWETLKLQKRTKLKPLQSAASISINDEILIFGGYQAREQLTKECYALNVRTLALSRKEDMKEAESFVSSEVVAAGDCVYAFGYVIGGIHSYSVKDDQWLYMPQSELARSTGSGIV
eukprot:TRINITY_DN8361_c0_g2_i2.p1 TRINITY_DN8361_c0_g2~~TRINITY_DN8361_c0_g2_i2.p1  ORF type:complete len:505 (-),score=164.75 TRINITY_DN8361_c0_g2_i2:76-1590(-)